MAEIQMVRVDFRLIHGQVITKWLRQTSANRIVIINDVLAADDFMKNIYVMAAPPSIDVDVFSVDTAINSWNSNQMGSGNLFVLFKDIETVYRAIKKGLPINDIQIGGLGAGSGRVAVFGPITLNEEDSVMLKELDEDGCNIYLHQVPDEPKMEIKKALEKFQSIKK